MLTSRRMRDRTGPAVGAAVLIAAIALGSAVRIQTAFSLSTFDSVHPERMLKSDPALLTYITQRILDAGGLPPDDFRADPRVEHPALSDLPAMFTVGQEFIVAWTYSLFGAGVPLHVFAVVVMAIWASLCAAGVYGLTWELTGRVRWAAWAAVIYAVTLANYRTLGFILVREDFSLPFFALHLWLLARAARLKTAASSAWAGLALVGALATWHAMGFVVAIEAACVFAWALRSGENPMSSRRGWALPGAVLLGSLAIPVLRAKLFALSVPVQIVVALAAAAGFARSATRPATARVLGGISTWIVAFTVSLALTRWLTGTTGNFSENTDGDYGHVVELLWLKLRTLGVRPDDPTGLTFGARLLWQGPFATATPGHLVRVLSAVGLLLPVAALAALPGWVRGRGDGRVLVSVAFAVVCTAAALLIRRLEILCGLMLPVVAATLLSRLRPRIAMACMLGLALVQAAIFAGQIRGYTLNRWYEPQAMSALAETVEWIRENLPPDGAVAADFVNSPAILAHTGHPIILQPKYETRRSRDRIERFITGLYRGSPARFHRLLSQEFDCRYLLIDLPLLWESRYQAGMPITAAGPPKGSAAARFLTPKPDLDGKIPGFRLLHRSAGDPARLRLYEIEPLP